MSISSLKVFCTSNVEKVSLSISEAILWNNMNVGKTSNLKRLFGLPSSKNFIFPCVRLILSKIITHCYLKKN